MKINHLKFLDKTLGFLLTQCFALARPTSEIAAYGRLLLIRPGGIGDAVLLAPMINTLKRTYPSIHITVLAEERNAGVFSLISGINKLFCYDRLSELVQALCCNYDMVIDSEQSHRMSAIVTRIVKAPVKIGFDTNERRRMFTHTVAYSHDDYEAVSFAHLLEPLGIEQEKVDTHEAFLTVPHAFSLSAAALLKPLQDKRFVVFFPGASISERRWGMDRFRKVAEALSIYGIMVVIVGGSEDRLQGEAIVGGGLGVNLAGLTTLPETAAVIQKSSLLVSADSGVMHIAAGLNKTTIALFGPGKAKKWAPQGGQHIVINKNLTCSPCTVFGTTPPCPIGALCMREITLDEVVKAVTCVLRSMGTIPNRF